MKLYSFEEESMRVGVGMINGCGQTKWVGSANGRVITLD